MATAKKTSETPQEQKTPGMAIAALVLGIVAILTIPLPILGLFVGIAAIILGIITVNKQKPGEKGRGMGIIGIVLGALGAIMNIIITIIFFSLVVGMVEDPTNTLRSLPGMGGCNIEEPLTCEAYDITGNTAMITLSTTRAGSITSVEGMVLMEGMGIEEMEYLDDVDMKCTWEGNEPLSRGAQQDFTITCPETIGQKDIIIFTIAFDGTTLGEITGMIVPE